MNILSKLNVIMHSLIKWEREREILSESRSCMLGFFFPISFAKSTQRLYAINLIAKTHQQLFTTSLSHPTNAKEPTLYMTWPKREADLFIRLSTQVQDWWATRKILFKGLHEVCSAHYTIKKRIPTSTWFGGAQFGVSLCRDFRFFLML